MPAVSVPDLLVLPRIPRPDVIARQRPVADVEDGHRVATACHLANISLRTGRKLQEFVWSSPYGTTYYRNASGTTLSTTFRQRYPIAPLWHEFSYANVQVNNLRNTLRALLKGLASGSVTVNDIDNFL